MIADAITLITQKRTPKNDAVLKFSIKNYNKFKKNNFNFLLKFSLLQISAFSWRRLFGTLEANLFPIIDNFWCDLDL